MTIISSIRFLIFVVTTILGLCTAAPEGSFGPLQCNIDSSIDSDICLSDAIALSSIVSEDESAALTIPCGKCVVVDYTDGSTITIPGGLKVIGRLHFPPSANLVLRTTAVFVKGMWSMSIPDDGNSVKISLYGLEEQILYPDDECCSDGDGFYDYDCSACSQPGTNFGYKPFAVIGGKSNDSSSDSNHLAQIAIDSLTPALS